MTEQTPNKVAEDELLRMTAEVVAAYLGNNTLPIHAGADTDNHGDQRPQVHQDTYSCYGYADKQTFS